MLLDIGAWDKPSEEAPHELQSLAHMPRFAAYTETKNRYIQSLGSLSDSVAHIPSQIFAQQVEHFHLIQKDPVLFRYTKDCISMAEIRLRLISHPIITSDAPVFLLERDISWDSKVFTRLRLSNWQLLAAMRPYTDLRLILTDYQLQLHKEKHQSSKVSSETELLTCQRYKGDCREKDLDILSDLFGVLRPQVQTQVAKVLQCSGPSSEGPEEDVQPDALMVVQQLGAAARVKDQPPSDVKTSGTSENYERRSFTPHPYPGQDSNPYAPHNRKRECSDDARSVKVPRLEDRSTAEEQRQPSVALSIAEDRNPFAKSVQRPATQPFRVAAKESLLREEIRELKGKLDSCIGLQNKFQDKTQAISSMVEDQLNSLQAVSTIRHEELLKMNSKNTKVITTNSERLSEIERKLPTEESFNRLIDIKLSTVEQVVSQILESNLNDLKATLSKQPSIGHDGYLSHYCPAPSTIAPAVYENALMRAAMHYFRQFADTDDPLVKDYDAMQETMSRYPDLIPGHIAIAIEHLHVMAHGHQMAD